LVFASDGSAGSTGVVAVVAGAYSAVVELRFELLDQSAGDLADGWEDATEFSATSSDGIAVGELFNGPKATLTDRAGSYRPRVLARGRDHGEERARQSPRQVIEHFLIQAWPATPQDGATLRATSLQPVDHTIGRSYLAPARAAATRIVADLAVLAGRPDAAAARALSGHTGRAQVEWTYSWMTWSTALSRKAVSPA
jgi:hypothetical protein